MTGVIYETIVNYVGFYPVNHEKEPVVLNMLNWLFLGRQCYSIGGLF